MFIKSIDFYKTAPNIYSTATPGADGGLKSSISSIIPNTTGASGYCLKRIDLNATSGNGGWNTSVPTITNNDLTLQVIVKLHTNSSSVDFGAGQKVNFFYTFATDDLFSASFLNGDNSTNQVLARTYVMPNTRLLNLALPSVTGTVTQDQTRYYLTDKITLKAQYLYIWIEHPNLTFNGGDGTFSFQVNVVA